LLALLTEGLTAAEIAGRIASTEESVRLKLDEMFAKIGASSRGQATAFALTEGVL
jgi:DNA-binding NarL/FixJ family response regulator